MAKKQSMLRMKKQRIDVVVCTKNSELTLSESLRRIVEYVPIKTLIVLDGASSDRTLDIARSYEAKIISDEGKGLGYARNLGCKTASTEIFGFIDSDAYIPENWFSLIRHFEDPSVALANGFTLYGAGTPVLERLYRRFLAQGKATIGFTNTMVRKRIVAGVGGIREDLPANEDYDLYERLGKYGYLWRVDESIITAHPQTLRSHLAHARWWGQGAGKRQAKPNLFINELIKSPAVGLALARESHPALLIYYPILRLFFLEGYIEGRIHSSRVAAL